MFGHFSTLWNKGEINFLLKRTKKYESCEKLAIKASKGKDHVVCKLIQIDLIHLQFQKINN